jgi:hypothetical protein
MSVDLLNNCYPELKHLEERKNTIVTLSLRPLYRQL